MPAAIARSAAASSPGDVLPAPVAATTMPVGAGRDRGVEQRPVRADPARRRGGHGLPAAPARPRRSRRRGPRARASTTVPPRPPPVRASRRWATGERRQRRRVHLGHVVRGLHRSGQRHDDARVPQVGRAAAAATASRRFAGPSKPASCDAASRRSRRPASPSARTRSQAKLVSSIVSVPWTTTTPSIVGIVERVPDDAADLEQLRRT